MSDPAAKTMVPLILQVFLPLTLMFCAWSMLAPVIPLFTVALGGGAGSVGVITASRSVRAVDGRVCLVDSNLVPLPPVFAFSIKNR